MMAIKNRIIKRRLRWFLTEGKEGLKLKLAYSAALVLSARVLAALGGFLVVLLMPKAFTSTEVGSLYFLLTQATLISIVVRFGVDYSVSANSSGSIENADQLRNSATFGFYLYFFISTIAALALGGMAYLNIYDLHLTVVAIAITYGFSFYLFQVYRLHGNVFLATLTRNFTHNLALLVFALAVLFFGIKLKDGLWILASLTFLVVCLNFVIFLKLVFCPRQPKYQKDVVHSMPAYFAYSLLIYFSVNLDLWIVNKYLGESDVALYVTAKRIALLAAIWIDVANTVLPKIFRDNIDRNTEEQIAKISCYVGRIFFIISGVGTAVVFFMGFPLYNYVFGPEYSEGFPVLIVFLISSTVVLATGFSEFFLILKNDKLVLIGSLILSTCIILLFGPMSAKAYGVVGIAVCSMVSLVLMRLSLTAFVFCKYKLNLSVWRFS